MRCSRALYVWVDELRTVPISKADLFALPQHIQSYGQEIFSELAREHHLAGLTRDELVDRLAHHLGNVNALHPFREGNGRAQRAFFTQVAGGLGYELRWQHIDAQRNTTAAIAAMRGNDMPLRQLLDQITVPRSAGGGEALGDHVADGARAAGDEHRPALELRAGVRVMQVSSVGEARTITQANGPRGSRAVG